MANRGIETAFCHRCGPHVDGHGHRVVGKNQAEALCNEIHPARKDAAHSSVVVIRPRCLSRIAIIRLEERNPPCATS